MDKPLLNKTERFANHIRNYYGKLGCDTSRLFVRPSDFGYGYEIVWEEGPYEWAITFSGVAHGYPDFCEDLGIKLPVFRGHVPKGIHFEPGYSYTLCVNRD